MIDSRKTRRIAPLADSYKLMQLNHTAKPDTGINFAMAAYLHIVAHNNFIFKYAVMPDMYTDHKQILIADFRRTVFMHTRMNCYLLTNDIIITYHQPSKLTIRIGSEDLRFSTDRAVGKKLIIFPDLDILAD